MQLSQRFRKNERLCSRYLIEKLFKEGSSFLVFPIRVTYFQIEGREIARLKSPLQVMFSVSKKRFKKSVQRNRIKRLMRECWRINKSPLTEKINKHEKHIIVSLVFIGESIPDFALLNTKIISIIKRLNHLIIGNNTQLPNEK
ncbi:MAG: ribonuclease P protein component [Bacteroidales bacterium]|jgi:ribonuclease P protein component|nr:ribonuclease P protein component [Bacteroidales bacterium]MDI9592703.1 ribonuclease P protein component [Bacteroidota bacterium]HOF81727.1 ribonuclease P protein component [Bacteroidales bacterium]HOR77002.1 ribonuclease P protein component [Bacteroidales bacterium]HPL12407.1 ribonuclease P protein component [Bacteroidales bacterium]